MDALKAAMWDALSVASMDNTKAAKSVILLVDDLVKPKGKQWAVMLVVMMVEEMVFELVDW